MVTTRDQGLKYIYIYRLLWVIYAYTTAGLGNHRQGEVRKGGMSFYRQGFVRVIVAH